MKSLGKLRNALPALIFLVLLLCAWQAAVAILDMDEFILPPPTSVIKEFGEMEGLWMNTRVTLEVAAAGFAIAAVTGILTAAAIVHFRLVERAVFPYVVLAQAIPVIAILPLLTIWMGFGNGPKITITAIICFAPIVTNTVRGLKATDKSIRDFMYSINAGKAEVFRKVEFLAALPYIFAAFRIAIPLSLIGAVVGEFYGSDRGLGFVITDAATQLRTAQLFVAVLVLGAIGVILVAVVGAIERRVIRWEPEVDY